MVCYVQGCTCSLLELSHLIGGKECIKKKKKNLHTYTLSIWVLDAQIPVWTDRIPHLFLLQSVPECLQYTEALS